MDLWGSSYIPPSSALKKVFSGKKVILTGKGSGVYQMDSVHTIEIKATGDLQLTPFYLCSMIGDDWIYRD